MKRALALILAVAVAPALAGAEPPKKKPKSGKYTISEAFGTGSGSFKINKKKKFAAFRFTPAATDTTPCAGSVIRSRKTKRLSVASRAGFSTWIVGKNAPATGDGVKQVRMGFRRDGKNFTAKVKVIFRYDNFKVGSGQLTFGDCDIEFNFTKG
jgi:hypothetical protein